MASGALWMDKKEIEIRKKQYKEKLAWIHVRKNKSGSQWVRFICIIWDFNWFILLRTAKKKRKHTNKKKKRIQVMLIIVINVFFCFVFLRIWSRAWGWNGFRSVHYNRGPWLANGRWGGATRCSQSRLLCRPLHLHRPLWLHGGGACHASPSVCAACFVEAPPPPPGHQEEWRLLRCQNPLRSPDPPLYTHTHTEQEVSSCSVR